MENFRIQARMAKKICKMESLPYPLENDGRTYLLKTGAAIFKARNGRYWLGSYAFDGRDLYFYKQFLGL